MIRRRTPDCETALDGRPVAATSPLQTVATLLDDMRLEAAARPAPTASPALAAIFGGLATAGALPGPVQRVSAQLGTHIGITLPGAPNPAPAPATPSVPPRVAPTSNPTGSPPTTTPRPTTTTTTAPPGEDTAATLPAPPPIRVGPIPLPAPDLRGPIGPTGIRIPVELLPRPTFRR